MDIFARVEPGSSPPPPPPALVEWAHNSALATLAGMLYGGAQAHTAREPPSPAMHPQARTLLPVLLYCRSHLAGHAAAQPRAPCARRCWLGLPGTLTLNVSLSALTPGLQIGTFAALFLGAQGFLHASRGEADWSDTAVAGGGTAGAFGALSASLPALLALLRLTRDSTVPRGRPARVRGLALGVGLGAGLGAPLGVLQQSLRAQLALQEGARPQQPAAPPAGAAAAAIERLEAR